MATCLAQNGARVCECLFMIMRKLNICQTLPVVALKNYKRQHPLTQTGSSLLLPTQQKKKTSNVCVERHYELLLIFVSYHQIHQPKRGSCGSAYQQQWCIDCEG